jgi:3-oxoacyl-[acyl-carrier protein] reductase
MNIIVTGASRGIGRELSTQLSELGHTVIAISRNSDALIGLAKNNALIIPITFDLLDGDFKELTQLISSKVDTIDGIVNNAGILVNKPFADITSDDLNNVFGVNVFGAFKLIQSITPLMEKSTLKHIVNISSMGGFQGSAKFAGLSAYSASKSAIACLSECLAEELKAENIKVNALAIGAVQTEMLAEAFPGYEAPLTSAQMATYITDFLLNQHTFYNGKTLPVSLSTP